MNNSDQASSKSSSIKINSDITVIDDDESSEPDNRKNTAFIPVSFAESLGHAVRGLRLIINNERNFRIQIAAALLIVTLAVIFRADRYEWISLSIVFSLVLTAEAINSVVEALCDVIYQKYNENVKYAKDVSAGAVLLTSLSAIVTGFIIFLPDLGEVWILIRNLFF